MYTCIGYKLIMVSFSVFFVADTAQMDQKKKVCNGSPDLLGCFEKDARKIIRTGKISTSPNKHSYMVSYLRREDYSFNLLKFISFVCLSVYHKLQPEEGSIGFSIKNDFKIVLNASHGYALTINDPQFGFPTSNPGAVPRTSLVINENRLVVIYLKVYKKYLYSKCQI